MSRHLPKPVGVWNWDVVNAVVPASTVPIKDGGEVWKIAIQVDVLSICPSIGPTI